MPTQRINLELSDDNYFFIRKVVSNVIRLRVENKIKGRVSQQSVVNACLDKIRHNTKSADEIVESLSK